MKLTFNGKNSTPEGVVNNIKVKINNMSKETFQKYVRAFTKDLVNVRQKTRQIIKSWLKKNSSINMPNMNTGLYHGNERRYNMLNTIIYDKTLPKISISKSGLKATITIPYGIDTDGRDNLVKNKKGVAYAQILDKWDGEATKEGGYSNPKIKRFNGFISNIKDEYRTLIMAQLKQSLTDKYYETIK